MGLLCEKRDNNPQLMELFTIGKLAFKRESGQDSYSKRTDCEAFLL